MVALLHAIYALWSLFPRDPLSDIGWAMEDGNTCSLTPAKEAHHLDIHQRHLVEVQHGPGAVALQLCLQGLKMLGLHVADQPECRVVPVSMPCNLAGHLRCSFLSSVLFTTVDSKNLCKHETICKPLTLLAL